MNVTQFAFFVLGLLLVSGVPAYLVGEHFVRNKDRFGTSDFIAYGSFFALCVVLFAVALFLAASL